MSTFYQAAKFSQRSKQLVKLGALSRRLSPGAGAGAASLSRNASGAIPKSLVSSNKKAAPATTRCAASMEDEGDSHINDKTSRRSVSNFAAAIPIALVGLLPFGRNKARQQQMAVDNADDSFVDFLEEEGGYHHEYFHSGVAEKLANYGISDD